MSITAIDTQLSTSMQASSSASAAGSSSSSTVSSSSSMTMSSTTASSSGSGLGAFLTSLGIGDDPAVQLMAAMLLLAMMGEQDSDSEGSGSLLSSLGSFSSFSSSSSSFTFSSTTSAMSDYSDQGAAAGGELDVTAGADTAVADGGGTTEPAPTEGATLDIAA